MKERHMIVKKIAVGPHGPLPQPVSIQPSPLQALSWAAVFLVPLAITLIWVSTSLEACQT